MIASLQAGFRYSLRHWKLAVYIFMTHLIGAGIAGYLLEKDLSAELGNSISGKIFNEGFNYTIIKDMLRDAPDALSNFSFGLQIIITIFFIISVFLQAGAIKCLVEGNSSLRTYVKNAARYFLPFLGLALIFLILFLMITGIVWIPLLMNALPMVEALESDKLYIWILGVALFIFVLLVSFIVNWSINTRINYAVVNQSIWSSLRSGFKWTKENYISLLIPFILFLFLGILIMYVNVKLDALQAIILTFVCSLILVFLRIFNRLWYYSSLCRFCFAVEL